MKLAFILFKLFPFGGLQRDCLQIAAAGKKRGHQIDIYALEVTGQIDTEIPIHVIPVKAWQNYQKYRLFSRRCNEIIKKKSYDAVVGFNKMPALDFYFAADPCYAAKVVQRHLWYQKLPRTRSFLEFEEAVFSPRSQTKILLLAPREKKIFQHFYQTAENRFYDLPPGIQTNRLAPANYQQIRKQKRAALGIKTGQKMILLVGSGFKTKGLDRACQAIASLETSLKQKVILYVVGQDNFTPFKRAAAKLGLRKQIKFLGGRDDIPELMFAADLLLHPAYRENTGTVLLEAMAAELPVLATDICGYSIHIQQAGSGCLIPSPFVQEKMNQLLAFMLNEERRPYWQQKARQYLASRDFFSLADQAVKIIERTS